MIWVIRCPPWPELTETQRRIIAAKACERDEMRREFEGLPAIPQGLPTAGNL
jgi:hypothetical protein